MTIPRTHHILALSFLLSLALPASAAPYIDEMDVPYATWRPLNGRSLRINLNRTDLTRLNAKTMHYWRGQAYAADHSYEEANEEFAQALPIENFSTWAVQQYAESLVGEEDFKKALPVIDYLIKRDPKNSTAYYLRGDLNFAGGKQAQAAADYIKSASFPSPRTNRSYLRASECLLAIHKYNDAVGVLSKAISIGGEGPIPLLYLTRATSYQGLNKWSEAASDFTMAISKAKAENKRRRDSEDALVAKALQERAKCYDKLGKRDLAFRDREAYKAMSRNIESDFFGK